jgi:hypothetical protein
VFKFGEKVAGYDIPVFNEREVSAAAGIVFLVLLRKTQMPTPSVFVVHRHIQAFDCLPSSDPLSSMVHILD